ncbi:MAG: PAS domain S-box protein [Nitrospirae bacterium]|nr:PAS domain S-box protein [Nitrospirota bacterium]MBF0539960.1 PAS domain S-box protein [Nitrospirota bacterium]
MVRQKSNTQLEEILQVIENCLNDDFSKKIESSQSSNELARIASGINNLIEKISKEYDSKISIDLKIEQILIALQRAAAGDFSASVEIEETSSDYFIALASGVNMLIEEIQMKMNDIMNTTVSINFMNLIINSMIDILIVTDSSGIIKTINNSALTLLGYEAEDLINKHIDLVFAKSDYYLNGIGLLELLNTKRVSNLQRIFITKNGERIPVSFSASVMYNKDNCVSGIVCIAQDRSIQEKMEAEARLREIQLLSSSKLATLGEVATGVAHEINQPLGYISGFIQNFEMNFDHYINDVEWIKDKLKKSFKQVNRIDKIIRHLRIFGRKDIDDVMTQQFNLESVLDDTMLIISQRIRLRNINFIKDIEDDLPVVKGSPNQMEQVFLNFFQNSIDALENISNAEIRIQIYKDKGFLIIKFSDNGIGITKDNLDKIFDPFFTTKEVGKGTGLGLSIVYGIIQEFHGSITCDSEINKGAAFTIELPIQETK